MQSPRINWLIGYSEPSSYCLWSCFVWEEVLVMWCVCVCIVAAWTYSDQISIFVRILKLTKCKIDMFDQLLNIKPRWLLPSFICFSNLWVKYIFSSMIFYPSQMEKFDEKKNIKYVRAKMPMHICGKTLCQYNLQKI